MSFLAKLRSKLPPESSLMSDTDIVASYSRDQALFAENGRPQAVLLARSIEEISIAVRVCNEEGVAVVARGAGSGLSGGANALDGCLVISFEKMNRIIEIDQVNLHARVEPGVINLDIDNEAAKFGLAYLPDPASRDWSTIGGNIATNAGGMCCVKYGVTSHHVRDRKSTRLNSSHEWISRMPSSA